VINSKIDMDSEKDPIRNLGNEEPNKLHRIQMKASTTNQIK
jgi:hypothetical protein